MPPHNLKLEGLFGRLRCHQRRISGCESTRELRDFGQYQLLFLAESEDTFTPQPEEPITDQLYAQALSCHENGDWEGTLAALEELRAVEPDYEAQEVVFYQQGQALAAEDQLEEALRSFDQALTWRPDSEEALEQRERLSLYLAGLGFWEADWGRATEIFAQLYALDANYRDVVDRLYKAHLAHGDHAAEKGDWCLAEAQYAQALELQPGPAVQEKEVEASERCAMASELSPIQPTTHMTITEGAQLASEQGTLVLTLCDPQLEKPSLYLIRFDPTGGPRWVRLGEGLSQLAFSPEGTCLAVRSSMAGQEGLYIIDLAGQIIASLPGTSQGMQPIWSPDGQHIAFVVPGDDPYSGHVYTLPVNGQGEPEEVALGWAPAWGPQGWFAYTGCEGEECGIHVRSPDGSELAFVSNRNGGWGLYLMRPDGSEVRKLFTLSTDYNSRWGQARIAWGP